jgi:hypothetical protein
MEKHLAAAEEVEDFHFPCGQGLRFGPGRNVFLQRTIAGSVFLRDFAEIILQESGTMMELLNAPKADAA